MRSDVETIILDNGSTDGTAEWLEAQIEALEVSGARISLIRLSENLGPGGARTRLFQMARGEVIVSLDSDVVVADGSFWLETLATALEPESVGLVGPGGSMMAADWSRFFAGKPGPVDTCAGFCWAFKRELLRAVKLDPAFDPFWAEDADFCFQIRAFGFDVFEVMIPIWHTPGHSGPANQPGLMEAHMRLLEQKWRGKRIVKVEGGY